MGYTVIIKETSKRKVKLKLKAAEEKNNPFPENLKGGKGG